MRRTSTHNSVDLQLSPGQSSDKEICLCACRHSAPFGAVEVHGPRIPRRFAKCGLSCHLFKDGSGWSFERPTQAFPPKRGGETAKKDNRVWRVSKNAALFAF